MLGLDVRVRCQSQVSGLGKISSHAYFVKICLFRQRGAGLFFQLSEFNHITCPIQSSEIFPKPHFILKNTQFARFFYQNEKLKIKNCKIDLILEILKISKPKDLTEVKFLLEKSRDFHQKNIIFTKFSILNRIKISSRVDRKQSGNHSCLTRALFCNKWVIL